MMPQRNQEKDSNGVNLVLNLGGRGFGSKNFDFYSKFPNFSGNFTKEYRVLQNIENFDFFRQLKKFDFPSKKLSIYSYLWANYSIPLQKKPLSNILPVQDKIIIIIFHDPSTTPTTPLRPSLRPLCPKSRGHDPQPPGLTALDSNGKEAFSRRKELP